MRKSRFLIIAALMVMAISFGGTAWAVDVNYSAGADLAAAELAAPGEPVLPVNGVWTYGTSPTAGGAFTQFLNGWHTDSAAVGNAGVFQGWEETPDLGSDLVPLMAVNTTVAPQSGVGAALGIGPFASEKFWVHSGPHGGEFAFIVLRWTAPADGTIDIDADWDALHDCTNGVTTHVRKNGIVLGADDLATFGFPVAYGESAVPVVAGDTIDFYTGPNSSYFCDSTEFDARIVLTVPDLVKISGGIDDDTRTKPGKGKPLATFAGAYGELADGTVVGGVTVNYQNGDICEYVPDGSITAIDIPDSSAGTYAGNFGARVNDLKAGGSDCPIDGNDEIDLQFIDQDADGDSSINNCGAGVYNAPRGSFKVIFATGVAGGPYDIYGGLNSQNGPLYTDVNGCLATSNNPVPLDRGNVHVLFNGP